MFRSIFTLTLLLLSLSSHSGQTSKICEESNYEIVKNSMRHFPQEVQLTSFNYDSTQVIMEKWSNYLPKTKSYIPWMLMNHPRTEAKEAAHIIQKYQIKKYFMGINPEIDPELDQSFNDYFLKQSRSKPIYSSEYITSINKKLDYIKNQNDSYKGLMKEFEKYSFWICSNYISLSCNSSLTQSLALLNPKENPFKNGGSFSLIEPLREFLTDPKIIAPLNYAAIQIKTILENSRSGKFPTYDLYRVIIESFKMYGMPVKQASHYTWLTLGVYGSRGSAINTFIDIAQPENEKLFTPLYYISTAINLIDHYMLKAALLRTFTLPPGMITGCDYAKPYHFWLSAYLARALRLNGYSWRVSSLSPHILGMMYQFKGVYSDTDKAFFEHKHSPSNNAVRVNISFNDLGAMFGSNVKRRNFHNSLLLRQMKSAKTLNIRNKEAFLKEINGSMLKKYYYWDRVIAPSANYLTLFSNF